MATTKTPTTSKQAIVLNRIAAMTASALLATAGCASILSLTGCNTTKGMGEDIEALGDSISDEADDAQH